MDTLYLPQLQSGFWHCLPYPHSKTVADDEQTADWKLNGWDQKVVISSTKSSWKPVGSGVPWAQSWIQPCSTSSLRIWMMGQRVPSAGLLVGCNREGWPVRKRVMLPSRGFLKVWGNGLPGSSGNSTKRNAKSFTQGETSLSTLKADQLEVV